MARSRLVERGLCAPAAQTAAHNGFLKPKMQSVEIRSNEVSGSVVPVATGSA